MTANANPFYGPKRRISRAKDQFTQFNSAWSAFIARNPWTHLVEPKAGSLLLEHKIKLTEPLPELLSDISFEMLGNLRSALDLSAAESARLGGVTNPKRAHFPIAPDAAKLETDVIGRGRCKDVPADIVALFRALQPYRAGNNAIWALNELCNGEKHSMLVPHAVTADSMRINFQGSGKHLEITRPLWDTSKDEIIFAVTDRDYAGSYDYNVTTFIAFGKIDDLKAVPAQNVLARILTEVDAAVSATENKCREIGILT